MSSVDDFKRLLLNNLTEFCVGSIDFDYWEDADQQSPNTIMALHATIEDAFEDILYEYKNAHRVWARLDEHRRMIQAVAWAALSVPYPVDPTMYLERFCVNAIILCRDMDDIRNEMISVNRKCGIIQRVWKKCISDPNYVVCKNRLEREYNEFSKEIEEFQRQVIRLEDLTELNRE